MDLPKAFLLQNRLLRSLSDLDLALVMPHADRVPLHVRQVLETAHQKIEYVYFLESGLGSVVAGRESGSAIEVGMFGRDGMSGTSLVQGDNESSFDCVMELEGYAIRVSAEDLEAAMRQSTSLKSLMAHYAHALGIQTIYTAWANVEIKLEQLLARWILMVDDRIDEHRFRVTQDFIATILGVRRAGITVALKFLEVNFLIKVQHREIFVLHRQGLIDLAKGTYGPAEVEYNRLIQKSSHSPTIDRLPAAV